jgi:hypothetical protein
MRGDRNVGGLWACEGIQPLKAVPVARYFMVPAEAKATQVHGCMEGCGSASAATGALSTFWGVAVGAG